MTKYKEKHLMKVRVRENGTINCDDLFDERTSVVNEQCSLLDMYLSDFGDVLNILDSRLFDEMKHLILPLKTLLQEQYVHKTSKSDDTNISKAIDECIELEKNLLDLKDKKKMN